MQRENGNDHETPTGRDEDHWAVVREQQLLSLQRQNQMHETILRLAASIEKRLEEFTNACMRRIDETDRSVHAVSRRVERLEAMMAPTINPLNGIIDQLTRQCGGNVHNSRVVNVTASSFAAGFEPEHAVDLRTEANWFGTAAEQKDHYGWICYDFQQRRVALTSYSIRTYNWGAGGYHPKSWVLEVSNEGSEGSWVIVDSRENNSDLNDSFVTRNFAVSEEPPGAFRFVRLRLTGNNHYGDGGLVLSALEVFGTISSQ